ncbi:hypothetical protein EYF80_017404 [Liparis tanakae]|uniref:Uncharacterized protein n=1 Tax=Liparis tanakae TaxID=230148 RepID=A0A4Z2I4J2_9TELE|nr:hypothetical protein EYF80_017404 [Liparis tanakae]
MGPRQTTSEGASQRGRKTKAPADRNGGREKGSGRARNSRRPNYISILDDASDLIRPLEKEYDTQFKSRLAKESQHVTVLEAIAASTTKCRHTRIPAASPVEPHLIGQANDEVRDTGTILLPPLSSFVLIILVFSFPPNAPLSNTWQTPWSQSCKDPCDHQVLVLAKILLLNHYFTFFVYTRYVSKGPL